MAEWKIDITKVVDGAIKEFKHQGYYVSKWTSVDEALPEDCIEVLVYDKECKIIMGWYNKKENIWSADFVGELETVTHWQPLPEPPKDGDTE